MPSCRTPKPVDAVAKLSRYEAHIQRAMFRALNELERLQASRRTRESMNNAAPPPPTPLELEQVSGGRDESRSSSRVAGRSTVATLVWSSIDTTRQRTRSVPFAGVIFVAVVVAGMLLLIALYLLVVELADRREERKARGT